MINLLLLALTVSVTGESSKLRLQPPELRGQLLEQIKFNGTVFDIRSSSDDIKGYGVSVLTPEGYATKYGTFPISISRFRLPGRNSNTPVGKHFPNRESLFAILKQGVDEINQFLRDRKIPVYAERCIAVLDADSQVIRVVVVLGYEDQA